MCPAPGRRQLFLFLALTFAVSWAMAGAYALAGGRWGSISSQVLGVVHMFVPMTVVIFIQKRVRHEAVMAPLAVKLRLNRWWLAAWLAPFGLTAAAFGLSLLAPGVRFSPELAGLFQRLQGLVPAAKLAHMQQSMKTMPVNPAWLLLGPAFVYGPTVNAVAAFGEELGWRGFLWRELSPLGFWRTSLLTGVIWGLWHAPVVLQGHIYPGHHVAGALMMVGWCTLLSPLFSFIRLKTGSVIGPAVLHGSVNAAAGFGYIALANGNDLVVGLSGLAGFIVLAAVDLGLLFWWRRAGAGSEETRDQTP